MARACCSLVLVLVLVAAAAAAAQPCVSVPNATCRGAGACFPLSLCTPTLEHLNVTEWRECDFATHFRAVCRDFLVFEHLVHLYRNASTCARAFAPHELALPSCAVARELVLCDGTRYALNASGLLELVESKCERELANITQNIGAVRAYVATDFFFVATQISFIVYFFFLVYNMRHAA